MWNVGEDDDGDLNWKIKLELANQSFCDKKFTYHWKSNSVEDKVTLSMKTDPTKWLLIENDGLASNKKLTW